MPFHKIIFLISVIFILLLSCHSCNEGRKDSGSLPVSSAKTDSTGEAYAPSMIVLPENPGQGQSMHVLLFSPSVIRKVKIIVDGPAGTLKSVKSKTGQECTYWRIDEFPITSIGKYKVTLIADGRVDSREFLVSSSEGTPPPKVVWRTKRGWDAAMEDLYSAWISALFQGCDLQSSWPSLHEVTRNPEQNFLYNSLALDEDNRYEKSTVIMQPDCADNPFFLRAYFAWKLGLPFGYHICDRGYVGRNPKPGQWITNETATSKANHVDAFNNFLRKMKDGVQSATARTALDDEKSDYYPISLTQSSLRPGTVFADPYGHTLILTGRVPQTRNHPGLQLAADAQPDGTVGIKQFWKGNFLFNTRSVVGEPGFKAFRPIAFNNGVARPMKNKELDTESGFIPFSMQQKKMETDVFCNTMERLINPAPLDPETALIGLINALHEQLKVRVASVANGEAFFISHQGAVIPMPSGAAGIFQTGGPWEDFSTPNRDLRLLIAIDAVLDFPERVAGSPGDFKISGQLSTEQVRKKLQAILDRKVSDLSITYDGTDGSAQKLTIAEILARREAFEMAYNPNDGIEIRWGAPEKSAERSKCRRRAPANQLEKMRAARKWFSERLHPPT
jgi:hypothetical protein